MVRQYLALKPSANFLQAYQSKDPGARRERTLELLEDLGVLQHPPREGAFTVVSAPSLSCTPELVDLVLDPHESHVPEELLLSFEFDDPELLSRFRELVVQNRDKAGRNGDRVTWIGADPGGGLADHWCPGSSGAAAFGSRADARRILNVDVLDQRLPRDPDPKVNVVIVDQGLHRDAIKPTQWGGGWIYKGITPGSAERVSHGMLVARNVLDIAPDAVVYDFPLIPKPVIANVNVFASDATAAFLCLLYWIGRLRTRPRWSGPWVIVNAWAIFDRASEVPLGDYTEDTNHTDPTSHGHLLNRVIASAALQHDIDVVFAAGNCGAFCPDARCGALDRGAGHSIWGANSSSSVITVGGVAVNDMWLGYSSQGPGQSRLGCHKPDFCAPSQFYETSDANVRNTGTSAACGLTAGVVAALRKEWDASRVSPQALRQALIYTARKTQGPAWNKRIGHGILDAGCAWENLAGPPTSTSAAAQSHGSATPPPPALPASSPGTRLARLGHLVKRLLRW